MNMYNYLHTNIYKSWATIKAVGFPGVQGEPAVHGDVQLPNHRGHHRTFGGRVYPEEDHLDRLRPTDCRRVWLWTMTGGFVHMFLFSIFGSQLGKNKFRCLWWTTNMTNGYRCGKLRQLHCGMMIYFFTARRLGLNRSMGGVAQMLLGFRLQNEKWIQIGDLEFSARSIIPRLARECHCLVSRGFDPQDDPSWQPQVTEFIQRINQNESQIVGIRCYQQMF